MENDKRDITLEELARTGYIVLQEGVDGGGKLKGAGATPIGILLDPGYEVEVPKIESIEE